MKFPIVICFAFATGCVAAGGGPAGDIYVYTNSYGEELHIAYSAGAGPRRSVTGHYKDAHSSDECEGNEFELTGFYYPRNRLLSLSAVLENESVDCQTALSWTGYFEYPDSEDKIVAQRNITMIDSEGAAQFYDETDVFRVSEVK